MLKHENLSQLALKLLKPVEPLDLYKTGMFEINMEILIAETCKNLSAICSFCSGLKHIIGLLCLPE